MSARHACDSHTTRLAAVAGQFYPDDPDELRAQVSGYLACAQSVTDEPPKAVIAPHAGYMYSGPIAGSAYACLAQGRDTIRRVVLLGPSHYESFRGLAASTASAFASPLGTVPMDEAALEKAGTLAQLTYLDQAHRQEHSLEVHLPFLQVALGDFTLVPLLVGKASPEEVAQVLEKLWGGAETCIVVSSDLSHYLGYEEAQATDRAAAAAIEALDLDALEPDQACGCRPIRGLLRAARDHGLRCRTLDLRNSGDTAGRRDRVVGYGAFAFLEAKSPRPS